MIIGKCKARVHQVMAGGTPASPGLQHKEYYVAEDDVKDLAHHPLVLFVLQSRRARNSHFILVSEAHFYVVHPLVSYSWLCEAYI